MRSLLSLRLFLRIVPSNRINSRSPSSAISTRLPTSTTLPLRCLSSSPSSAPFAANSSFGTVISRDSRGSAKDFKNKSRPAAPYKRRSSRQARPSRSAPAPKVYTHTDLRIALVGRPNVGKSTLFNRLCSAVRGRGTDPASPPAPRVFVRSVVDAAPGVTRDPRDATAALSDLLFTVVDTPGLEHAVGAPPVLPVTKLVDHAPTSDPSSSPSQPSQPLHVPASTENPSPLAAAQALCDDPAYRSMYRKMEAGTANSVHSADVVFLLVDAAEGVTVVDRAIADWIRSTLHPPTKPIIVLANKCDTKGAEDRIPEACSLGFGDPVALSAEQGLGFGDLYTVIDQIHQRNVESKRGQGDDDVDDIAPHTGYADYWPAAKDEPLFTPEEEENRSLFDDDLILGSTDLLRETPLPQLIVSIVGRPNVGKSTLLNRLVGQDRSIVGPEAGVTRDAVLCEWPVPRQLVHPNAPPVWLVDTAGVRSQMKVLDERLETASVKTSLRALRHSHVVCMVLDAQAPLVQQDCKILDLVVTEGRAAVLIVNKIDTLKTDDIRDWRLSLRYTADRKLAELTGIEIVEMSAKQWEDDPTQLNRLYAAVQRARARWEKRVPTAALNRFVSKFNERMSVGGGTKGERRNRIGVTKFITQKKIRPPMFRLDGSSAVSQNYVRSLTNAIRLEFGFQGVPVRVKRPSRRGNK